MEIGKAREVKKIMDMAYLYNDISEALSGKDTACMIKIYGQRKTLEVNLDKRAIDALRDYYKDEIKAIVSEIEGIE